MRVVNDAAMQALGSYQGGRMLFLGLGTGLGSALVADGTLAPLELAHLPYRDGRSYEDFVGLRGMKRLGKKKWRKHVARVVALLKYGLQVDYVMLGGGQTKYLKRLPRRRPPGDERPRHPGRRSHLGRARAQAPAPAPAEEALPSQAKAGRDRPCRRRRNLRRLERALTTRLYLVRHGATELTAEDRFSGSVGVDLSEEGRGQVRRLATRIADDAIAAVYCSPLEPHRRDRRHPRGAAPAHSHPPRRPARDQPRPLGGLDPAARWRSAFPTSTPPGRPIPSPSPPQDGESGLGVLARALPVVREIVVAHPDETVLVVSHKATLRLILSSLLGFDARGYRDRLDQSPACLNVVDFKDPVRARLMLFNDISHYQDTPRTPQANLSKWWDVPASPTRAGGGPAVSEATRSFEATRVILPIGDAPHARRDWRA